ncbi:hypothetical protein GLOTRDRAFT_51620, partial [Gloeophyllum trabeum ATCC 11539]
MTLRGPTKSSTIISMTPLNLGVELMSKPENVYLVGVIPGPKEPSLTQLNNYIRPVINILRKSCPRFRESDDPEAYQRSALSPDLGRIARSALAVVVNDLPGARRLAQMAGPTSKFLCTMCDLFGIDHLHDTNYHSWRRLNNALVKRWAEEWRDASSVKDQRTRFDNHGVRWSELWRLPYWDVTRQLAPEPMHALFLNVAEHLVR